jgi:hypothetical protein
MVLLQLFDGQLPVCNHAMCRDPIRGRRIHHAIARTPLLPALLPGDALRQPC